jgi:uncharacterized protein YbaA (DUF1428 family)
MPYIDSFVVPVPKANLEKYRALAELARSVWLAHGALSYSEWLADDAPAGEVTSFPRSVQLADDEVVIVAYVTYASREERDRVNEAVMKDPRMNMDDPTAFPFDGKRMFWGGFKAFVG